MFVGQNQARSPFRAVGSPDFVRMAGHRCYRKSQLPKRLVDFQRGNLNVSTVMLGSIGTADRLKGVRDLIGVWNPALNERATFQRRG